MFFLFMVGEAYAIFNATNTPTIFTSNTAQHQVLPYTDLDILWCLTWGWCVPRVPSLYAIMYVFHILEN